MVYLFYGENTYTLSENLLSLKKRFIKEQGDMNISEIDGNHLSKNEFFSLAFSLPFLSSKRLVIIKNLLLGNSDSEFKKYVADNLSKVPDSTVLIFAEYGMPDKRLSLFKILSMSPKNSKNFQIFSGLKLENWLSEKVLAEGGKISKEALQNLQVYCGNDLWKLENEIKKLVLYQKAFGEKEITSASIEKLVEPILSPNIFEFIEAGANGNTSRATKLLYALLLSGENELKIFSMIVYQFRIMLILDDLLRKKLSPNEMSKCARIHPYVVQKTLHLIKKWDREKLINYYLALGDIDAAIKSGQIDSGVALNLFIGKLGD